MYCENEHLNPSAKHEQCSFQIVMQGHSLDWIPWCISFFLLRGILCLAWNFLLSVQKRKAEIALNSFMMESEDGTMVFKWLVCQKNSSSYFFTVFYEKKLDSCLFLYVLYLVYSSKPLQFLNKVLFNFSVIVQET